ncbi:MAG TPA: ferritin-like domain-containing protein, partial [Haliangium sp.]|nr:ferritin-like domain-containing protein [Haliangium sp.]
MSHIPPIGDNRTGIALHPRRTAAMVKGVAEFPPTSHGNAQNLAEVRIAYAKHARPAGSMPLLPGKKPSADMIVFMDKLGARLAFERSGVRLYEGLLAKYRALGSFDGGPTRADLEHIRSDEHEHFAMLHNAIESVGGDPTAVTPSANVEATLSQGVLAVVVDPRTSLYAAMQGILVAELADNEQWDSLVQVA